MQKLCAGLLRWLGNVMLGHARLVVHANATESDALSLPVNVGNELVGVKHVAISMTVLDSNAMIAGELLKGMLGFGGLFCISGCVHVCMS